jgi:hypothetical protein
MTLSRKKPKPQLKLSPIGYVCNTSRLFHEDLMETMFKLKTENKFFIAGLRLSNQKALR